MSLRIGDSYTDIDQFNIKIHLLIESEKGGNVTAAKFIDWPIQIGDFGNV